MSVTIQIIQKGIFKKSLPDEIILGENLYYGILDGEALVPGERCPDGFLAFNPKCIGRGISVLAHVNEKHKVELHINNPTTAEELRDFYDCVARIAHFWNVKNIIEEGNKTALTEFLNTYEKNRDFNWRALDEWIQKILDDEYEDLVVGGALWPLVIDLEDAKSIRGEHSLESFRDYLNRMQNIDWYFASPRFFDFPQFGLGGVYIVIPDTVSLFPNEPKVPFGIVDPETNEPMDIKKWIVGLSMTETALNLPYEKFITMLPAEKVTRYNSQYIKVAPMSSDEWQRLFEEQKDHLLFRE